MHSIFALCDLATQACPFYRNYTLVKNHLLELFYMKKRCQFPINTIQLKKIILMKLFQNILSLSKYVILIKAKIQNKMFKKL